MGCSNASFEINKSKENIIEDNKEDDVIKLMRLRMEENKDKEVENHDLIKIKSLYDNLDLNNDDKKETNEQNNEKKDEINIINNVSIKEIENKNILSTANENQNLMITQEENNKNNDTKNDKDKDNHSNDNKDIKNELDVSNDLNNNENNNLNNNNDNTNINNNIDTTNDKNISSNNILEKYFNTKKMNKSSIKKSSIKINKEPFILKTIKEETYSLTTIKINATYFLKEYLIPIWFEKDSFIKFSTSGKWRIDKKYDFTDTKGMPTSNTLDFNYGACIARVGTGAPFIILPGDFTYITKTEGPLYLRMNLPRRLKMNPEGKIEIKIYDGEALPIEQIYEKIGWKENNTRYGDNKGSDLENSLMSAINNLRMNPVLFYQKYLRDVQNILWIEKYIEEKEIHSENNGNVYRKPFKANDKCYKLLDNYVNDNYVNKKNINRQKVSLYLNEMKDNLELYINMEFKHFNLVNCKLTQKYKVYEICLQYLLDKKFRNYIFNNAYNYITVKIVENYIDESNLLILCLSKINESDNDKAQNENEEIENLEENEEKEIEGKDEEIN